jgi:anaerobic selenocysteine-containing dehydrogenase
LHRTRDTADVVLQLAGALGGSVAAGLPWASFDKLLHAGARGLYEARRGYAISTHAEESLRRVLERQGYWAPEFASYEEFWKGLLARGAWWDPTGLPVGRQALLQTASGRFEFYTTALREKVDAAVKQEGPGGPFTRAVGGGERGDRAYLPLVPMPSREQDARFPLRLNTYRLVTRPLGGGGNQPWLLEQPAVLVRGSWERWVEVHPDTAAGVGIKDGDWVWVESARGRIRLQARLSAGTQPEVVNIPLFGGRGPSQNELIANEPDVSRGFGLLNTTRVKLSRAS